MDKDSFTVALAIFALVISIITFWFVHMRRGTLRASKPQSIFFGPDGRSKSIPKVYASTFIYTTGERGHVIEAMFVRIKVKQTVKNFTVWVYDQPGGLRRGSGLFVGRTGIAANHHFLLPSKQEKFDWQSGDYEICLVGQITGRQSNTILWTEQLTITEEQTRSLSNGGVGIYFDWDANRGAYDSHLDHKGDEKLDKETASKFAEAMLSSLKNSPTTNSE